MSRKWHGTYVKRARKYIAAQLPAPCWRCGRMIAVGEPFTVGHLIDAAIAPEMEHDPGNWAVECPKCNYSAGATAGNRRRRRRPVRPTSRQW